MELPNKMQARVWLRSGPCTANKWKNAACQLFSWSTSSWPTPHWFAAPTPRMWAVCFSFVFHVSRVIFKTDHLRIQKAISENIIFKSRLVTYQVNLDLKYMLPNVYEPSDHKAVPFFFNNCKFLIFKSRKVSRNQINGLSILEFSNFVLKTDCGLDTYSGTKRYVAARIWLNLARIRP